VLWLDDIAFTGLSTGTQAIVAQSMAIHPDPVDGQFELRIPHGSDADRYRVLDAMGRNVLEGVLFTSTGRSIIDVHALAPGRYVLEVSGGWDRRRLAFVKR
jgi:hypothetical protein